MPLHELHGAQLCLKTLFLAYSLLVFSDVTACSCDVQHCITWSTEYQTVKVLHHQVLSLKHGADLEGDPPSSFLLVELLLQLGDSSVMP